MCYTDSSVTSKRGADTEAQNIPRRQKLCGGFPVIVEGEGFLAKKKLEGMACLMCLENILKSDILGSFSVIQMCLDCNLKAKGMGGHGRYLHIVKYSDLRVRKNSCGKDYDIPERSNAGARQTIKTLMAKV